MFLDVSKEKKRKEKRFPRWSHMRQLKIAEEHVIIESLDITRQLCY